MFPIITPFVAFAMPAFVIWRVKSGKPLRYAFIYSIISFISCTCNCINQIFVFNRRIISGDFSGIEDTIGAVILICIGVLIFTVILNLVAMFFAYSEKNKEDEKNQAV